MTLSRETGGGGKKLKFLLLTKQGGILGPFATLFGFIMDAIFRFCNLFGVKNIALCIILFTLITKLLMFPLTIKQQKFSKMMTIMNPELQALQEKYKDKKDQQSQMKFQAETQAVYEKYGVSPTAGCLPMLIQFPIIFALYRVILNIPAYVSGIKDIFISIMNVALQQDGFASKIISFAEAKGMRGDKYDFTGATEASKNFIIDLMYKFDKADWSNFYNTFDGIEAQIGEHVDEILHMNSFFGGLNLLETPMAKGFLSIGLIIPILAGLTQWLSSKLMDTNQNAPQKEEENAMASSMKSMMTIMPLMSVVMCLFMPIGLGIYWVASSVFMIIQQLIINNYMNHLDVNQMIQKSIDKKNAKRAKQGLPPVNQNTLKNAEPKTFKDLMEESKAKAAEAVKVREPKPDSTEYYKSRSENPNSIAARARMVKDFEEKNAKKK